MPGGSPTEHTDARGKVFCVVIPDAFSRRIRVEERLATLFCIRHLVGAPLFRKQPVGRLTLSPVGYPVSDP